MKIDCPLVLVVCLLVSPLIAAEHRVEKLAEGPPTEGLSKEVASQLADTGVKVIRGSSRTVCEIWLCKHFEVEATFKPTTEVLYPFRSGQLIGVVRYQRKGRDFRNQEVAAGIYTLRYGQQPIDGNHEGTSPTRDFLCLLQVEKDKSIDRLDTKVMLKLSAEAAETNHPALLCLQKVKGAAKAPAMRHNEDHDWWIVRLEGAGTTKEQPKALALDLVVAGHANE